MDKIIQWKRYFVLLFFVLTTLLILYLSWIPDSELKSEVYIPLWLRNWSNTHYNLRTGIPFVGFGFFLAVWFSKQSEFQKTISRLIWLRYSFIAFGVACLAEGGQFFIMNRYPDIVDVFYGVVGSQLGFLFYFLFCKTIRFSL
jgi:glycopeptide antibiotics resistance protein